MMKIKRLAAVLVAAAVLGPAAPALAVVTPADTLISLPVPRVCLHHRFKVGVYAQPGTSWADRRYVVTVRNPHGVRVLHKSGHARIAHWLFWHVPARKLGRYHTTYKTWSNGTPFSNRYPTRSHRC